MPIHLIPRVEPEAVPANATRIAGERREDSAADAQAAVSDPPLADDGRPPQSAFLRLAAGSLSPSPFLLSPGMGWAMLDFLIAYCLSTLGQLAIHRHPAHSIETHLHPFHLLLLSGVPFALFAMVCTRISGLHRFDRSRTAAAELRQILQSVTLAAFALLGFQTLWQVAVQPLAMLSSEAVLVGAAMALSRILWRSYRQEAAWRRAAQRNILIVGANRAGREVRDYLTSLPNAGYRFHGFASMEEAEDDETEVHPDEIVVGIRDVVEFARSRFVDEIIFSRRPSTRDVLSRVIAQARGVGIDIRLIPSLSETLNNRADVQYIEKLPTIAIFQVRHHHISLLFKRAIDVLGAAAASLILLPIFAMIALAVRLESSGPALYRGTRVGYKGRVFTCYKFRTMVQNAASMQAQIAHLNEREGVLFKVSNDPRVTRVGSILRKYSLDELPQLWNVLRGDMSLVGPRPSISSEVAQYQAAHLRRLDVVPGITGLWQVEARQDPSFERYIKLDSKYVNNWSLWLDLKILVRTIGAVVTGTGA